MTPESSASVREFHELGGLKANKSEVEPTLRAFPDVADGIDDDEQNETDDVQPRRQPAQHARPQLREHQHEYDTDRESGAAAQHRLPVSARGAEEYELSIHCDGGETGKQRAVETQAAEQLRRSRQGSLRGAVHVFAQHHSSDRSPPIGALVTVVTDDAGNLRSR
jgi:hypothetical protein